MRSSVRGTWLNTSSTLTRDSFCCAARLVVTIYDLLLASILGVRGRLASIAYPFSYSGTRARLRSFWYGSLTYRWYVVVDWIYYFLHGLTISIGHKGLKLERVDWGMWPKRLVRLPSLLCIRHVPTDWNHHKGLTVCIFSRLNQQIEVMCRCDLLRCKGCTIKWKLRHYEWLRFGVMRSLRWDFQRDSIDAICVILWGFQGAALRPAVASFYSGFLSAPAFEHVVRLTCFCRVWCEWYGLNIMWWCMW
jgi:hypothetical protein